MRPLASTRAPQARLQRHFDPRRLAQDCQAHAYEHVLPVVRRSRSGTALPPPRERISQQTNALGQGAQAA